MCGMFFCIKLLPVESLYSNTLNEDTSVYSGTPLFQHPEMRTPLYTVEPLYSNTLKWTPLFSLICPNVPRGSIYQGSIILYFVSGGEWSGRIHIVMFAHTVLLYVHV